MRHLATEARQLRRSAVVDVDHEYVSMIDIYALVVLASNSPNVFGIIGITRSPGPQEASITFLFQDLYGQISGFLSLCTNILATSLIAYKALCVVLFL